MSLRRAVGLQERRARRAEVQRGEAVGGFCSERRRLAGLRRGGRSYCRIRRIVDHWAENDALVQGVTRIIIILGMIDISFHPSCIQYSNILMLRRTMVCIVMMIASIAVVLRWPQKRLTR